MFQKKKKGTILSVETILYLSFLLLIVYAAMALYSDIVQTSKIKRAQADMAEIAQAVSHYHYDMGEYPDKLDDLTDTTSNEKAQYYGPWIAEIKDNPWKKGEKYQYHTYKKGNNKEVGFVVYVPIGGGDGGSEPSSLEDASNYSSNHIKDKTLFVVGR